MKKIAFLIAFLGFASIFGQEETNQNVPKTLLERKHEVKFGALKLLAGPIFEGTYEYIYSKDFTFGSSILVDFKKQNDWYEDFSITPFARFYFQETKEYGAKGFFVEGFGKIATGSYNDYNYSYDYFNEEKAEKFTTAALGLSLGRKWINHSGFVFEALIGVGRNLGNTENAPEVFFRGDLGIGYRF